MQIIYYTIFQTPEDLWAPHSLPVSPRPHRKDNSSWIAIQKVMWEIDIPFFQDVGIETFSCFRNLKMFGYGLNELTINLTFDSYIN